jgi:predicted transposase YbfD/YdcC
VAWYWDNRGVRGEGKESELGLASNLLAQLELRKKVVTGDALYCQRELSLRVLEQGGDYLWALKDNQPGVKEAVSLLFEQPPWGESFAEASQEGRRGDRWEKRRLWASTALNEYLDWPGLGQVCCVERTRRHKGRETVERAYAITSLPPERAAAARLLGIWRGHWGIENRLHWVRDVVFGEDQSQVRTGSAPQLLAALRNLVIGMLRLGGVKNISAALRHYGWKPWETLTLIGLPANN